MDLRRLEIFAKVAELGSFSRAAGALNLTQPTISEHIRSLEDELGVQLLDRLGRGAAPTRAGRLLLDYAGRMLALAREARQALDQFQGRLRGELVVGASTIPGEYVLPALIGGFRRQYPEVGISLLIGSSSRVCEWLEQGRVEVGMVGAPPAARALESRPLMADELVVVVPSGHAWEGRESVSVEELRREPILLRELGSGSRQAVEAAFETAGLSLDRLQVAGEIGSTQAIKQAVRAGLGVTLVSRRAVEDECRAGLVHCLRVEGVEVTRSFHLVVHRDRSRSPLAQAFVEFLESRPECGPSKYHER